MKTNIDENKIKELIGKDFAVFAFDSECDSCHSFIPEATKELNKYNVEVYYIEAKDMVLPASTLPTLYMFKNDSVKPTIRVGDAPIDLVRSDFERFYKKV